MNAPPPTGGEFCVVCGRTDRPLTEGVCADCAADRTTLASAPERVEVVICPHCGARRKGRLWEREGGPPQLTAADLTPFVSVPAEAGLRSVEWEELQATATVREFRGHARVGYRGIERTVDVPLSVRLVRQTCTDCSRRSGRYYTALLQLRGPPDRRIVRPRELRERLERRWDELVREARPDWRAAVSWREERPEGWDCYFTDTLAARAMARLAKQRFGAALTESASLVGRKNGEDLYRVTFCLRFADAGPHGPPPGGRAAARGVLEP
jgi:nonsense-mediated mRNA decay protein 3